MKLETVADRRLHPATFLIRTVRALPQYVLGMPAIVGIASDTALWTLLLLAAGGAAAAVVGAWLYWKRFRYGLGAREMVIESGILHRQRRVIPFDRIQDIDIEQGLLARLFGTAKVKIETGGGAKDEGSLDSVALAEARRLRDVLRRAQASASAEHEEQAPPQEEEPVLFHMTLGRVLLAGVFNFSLVYLAFVFGAFEWLEAFGVDPLKMDWIEPARVVAQNAPWGMTALALLLVVLICLVAGILRTVARDFDFRLTRTGSGFRRRRGLFTLSEVVIPLRRVQLSLIRSGLLPRHLGWFRLEFQTLSAEAGQAGHQVAAPLARLEEVRSILSHVSPAELPPEEDYVRVSKRHILRQSLRWAVWLALAILAGASFWRPALAFLLALPLLVGLAAYQWRHHRYCLTATHLHVRSGLFTRSLWIIPYGRIQALAIDRGPLQRSLGLATLAVDTAGASSFRSPYIASLPADGAEALASRLTIAHREARARLRGKAA